MTEPNTYEQIDGGVLWVVKPEFRMRYLKQNANVVQFNYAQPDEKPIWRTIREHSLGT